MNNDNRCNYIKAVLMFFVLLAAVAGNMGCTHKNDPEPVLTATPAPTSTPTAAPTPLPTATPTPTPSPTPTPIPKVQDVFDKSDDEGVYLKQGIYSDMYACDINCVGNRLIISTLSNDQYESDYSGDWEYEDMGDGEYTGEDEGDGEDESTWEEDDTRVRETLHLHSVDPVTWDSIDLDLDGWAFFSTTVTPIDNEKFALTQYYGDKMCIYSSTLELLQTIELDTQQNFIITRDGNNIWYIKDNGLFCYDIRTGEETKPDFYGKTKASYFREYRDSDIAVMSVYEPTKNDSVYYNYYFNTKTGECYGKTDYDVRYIYSPDMKRAVRVDNGRSSTIKVYECSEGNYFPGEPQKDEETGEELPAAAEERCRIKIENASETNTVYVDWNKDVIITDVYYRGNAGALYEYCCYSLITGEKLSNYLRDGFGYASVYYTIDYNEGLYYTEYCDQDNNVQLFAWDYAADTVREYKDAFGKFSDIPEKVELKRRELEEKYGFYFYVGSEVFASDFSYDLAIYKDYDNVCAQMDVIDEVLSIYPEGFFEQFKYGGIKTLSIYLCGGFSKKPGESNTIEDAIALACVFDYERALALDLNYSYCLKRTIVHELSHWIDGRIDSEAMLGGYADFSDEWLKLNPSDFNYKYSYVSGRTIWKYIYDSSGKNENTYFIDDYSQTYPTEDRARLFEYLMYNEDEEYSDYLALPHLQEKLKFFFETIRKCFDTSKWPEKTVWEERLEEKMKNSI